MQKVLDEDGDPQLVAIEGREDREYEPELVLVFTQLKNHQIIEYWAGSCVVYLYSLFACLCRV
jgi:hypothetical protein